MRRSKLLLLGVAALVLAACEIRTDYDMFVEGDASATLAFEITYDGEAAQLFGPAEQFLEEEIQDDVGEEIDGVTLLSAEADSSDPDQQRVTATFGAEDGDAFNMLVEDLFPGSSFTNTDGDTWVLSLRPDEDVADDFDDEFPLDEFGLDFISGEVRLNHEGSQVSMSGGESGDGNLVLWDPYGADSLEVTMDLSGDTPPAAAEEPEEPAEEPEEVEEPEAEEPEEVEEPAEEVEDDLAAEDGDAAVAVGEDDDGISTLLLVALAVGLLLLLLVIFLVIRSRGKKKEAEAAAQEPVGAGVGAGAAGAAGPAGSWDQQGTGQWDQTQAMQPPAQSWDQPQQGAGQWDQTQAMQPPGQSWDQPQQGAGQWDQPQGGQQPTQGWEQPQPGAAPPPEGQTPPSAPQPPSGPPAAPPPQPGGHQPPASPPEATPSEQAPPEDDGRPRPPQPPPPPPS